ncbi:hypothetical protein [Mycobacterium leprae]|uniref:hypothetical protein n=1 Tax=Mycobacterium leprae TaxID=1769 RepID=UPI001E424227|nr:hypothetical protein [Mycobacterium leprae]
MTTSAPTSPTCPTYTPNAMICCTATNSCATIDLDDWTRTDGVPSDEEVRRLID